ncbi:GNAT family N-acetyltransferase [Gloeothece verrucosa]|uniref:GCN5-related N-acetyltransferase n=1 Tax=Gloeothece verrucosa (strain PCC 7822) TaxID=497965 RepID=E0U901_GLOV7|nr:GNAT family N-acetyltransferase [Gloeothece verrucosa]ADN16140.1 GCN5-related N-acetyltransferase [Gloeothece verrucosa PCC 7822]
MKPEIIDHLSEKQIQELCQLFQSTWWAKGRKLPDVQRMLNHSDLIVALCHHSSRQLLGFSRILTDYVYRAILFDVVIRDNYRQQGLGKILMEAIINHPDLQEIEGLILFCQPEVIPFYQKWGFWGKSDRLEIMIRPAAETELLQEKAGSLMN